MTRLLMTGLLFGFAFAAQAQSGSVTVKDDADQAVAQMPAADALAQHKLSDRNCLRSTGSLITARQNDNLPKDKQTCAPVTGRSYSRDDIDRTGSVNLADALRKLDTAVH
ncbi:MAG: hypothetical protein ABJA62_01910 [Luteimonas sp.]